ncbi:MAG: sialate O-acetylesterase [Lentisphaeria bacterium]|nr:sialate O-acetylesterase [Lentisphaeria bacterium]
MKRLTSMMKLMVCAASMATLVHGAPLRVYILAGQSNMQGKAAWYVLPGLADDPATRHLHEKFVDENGEPRISKDVYVAAISDGPSEKNGPLTIGFGNTLGGNLKDRGKHAMCWGPEWGFGVTLHEKLREPILIIKTSWGGKSLNTDFRSPSAGAYTYGEDVLEGLVKRSGKTKEEIIAEKAEKTGHYYRLMVEQVKKVLADPGAFHPAYDPKQGVEIAGFVWFQGWNDQGDKNTYPGDGPERFAPYTELLTHFIRDARKDLNAPDMPFVIGVMGNGNPDFRPAMAAPASLPQFKGNVVAVHTETYVDPKLNELVDRSWRWMRPAWDPEKKYTDLREKLLPLQKEMDGLKNLEDQKERARRHYQLKDQMEAISYTPEEIDYLKKNRSSQGYHYNGSPKFFARVGEAFAKALLELSE